MRKVAGAFAAALAGTAVALVLINGGAGATTAWSCVVTGEQGGTHNYTVQANDAADALAACKDAWVASATYKVSGGTTTSTTTSSTSSSTTSSTTTVPPGAGYPQLGGPFAFNGGFDPACQLLGSGGGWDSNVSGSDHPGTASVERGVVGDGTCSARFSTPGGSSTGRSEVARNSVSAPVRINYEYLLYVPSPANNGPGHGVLQQTKQGGSGGGCFNGGLTKDNSTGALNFSTVGSCSGGSAKHNLGPVPYDHWFGVHVDETFADSGHALVQIDADGKGPGGYVTKLNVSTDTLSGSGVKLRLGLYHDEDAHESHVFGDGFHIAG